MSKHLGQQITIENAGGAGGSIGTAARRNPIAAKIETGPA
jgi:tripartite-type tricarboxylate transporter receptor subunit TctC